MNKEQLDFLDDLLLSARKSVNSKLLHFDDKGSPISEPIDKEIYLKIKTHLLKCAPPMLYRYRPGNAWDIENIKNGNIWLSTLSEFNDPFECKIYIDFEKIANDLIQLHPDILMLMKINHIDQNHPIYKNYINESKENGKKLIEELAIKRNRAFVASFSENKNSLLMWAHYANSHKGFCIGYDFRDIIDMFGVDIFPIRYSDEYLTISSLKNFYDHDDVFLKSIKTKSMEWAYEKEWRLFCEYKINEPYKNGMITKMIKPQSIYLGAKIDYNIKQQLIEICKKKKINLYQIQLSDKRYGLLSYRIL